jgi:hypothetical protein
MDRNAIAQTIIETLDNFGLPPDVNGGTPFTEETLLFGPGGVLDSVALVAFILDTEDAIRTRSGVSITLADERAMSQHRSPFRRVSNLADYAVQLVAEQQRKP